MPELPEVETVCQKLHQQTKGYTFHKPIFFRKDIRELIPQKEILHACQNNKILAVKRRGKYILMHTVNGTLLLHLGMSGKILINQSKIPLIDHTHAIFPMMKRSKLLYMHFVDPRRFGRIGVATKDIQDHPFLKHLGLEPMATAELGEALWQLARKRSVPIKTFMMDNRILVGVGNIYASESLFLTRIRPTKRVSTISKKHFQALACAIKTILRQAIIAGGTTLKDYRQTDGSEGYFHRHLLVYDQRECLHCQGPIKNITLGGRSSFYCPACQK